MTSYLVKHRGNFTFNSKSTISIDYKIQWFKTRLCIGHVLSLWSLCTNGRSASPALRLTTQRAIVFRKVVQTTVSNDEGKIVPVLNKALRYEDHGVLN
jgi:hypothetical protein